MAPPNGPSGSLELWAPLFEFVIARRAALRAQLAAPGAILFCSGAGAGDHLEKSERASCRMGGRISFGKLVRLLLYTARQKASVGRLDESGFLWRAS